MNYAKIKDGVVINTLVANDQDFKDPSYIWVDIDNIKATDGSPVQVGYTYDGKAFTSNKPKPSYSAADQYQALWDAASAYQKFYISEGGYSLCTMGVLRQLPKSLAVMGWMNSIWMEYYTRKTTVIDGADHMPDLDFSKFGDMPYTIPDIMQEVFS